MSSDLPLSCARVAVCLPVANTFTYTVPPDLDHAVGVGSRVLVPFGSRTVTGYVLERHMAYPEQECRDILEVPDSRPLFNPRQSAFFEWIADYYLHPVGQVIRSALPGGLDVHSTRDFVLTEQGSLALDSLPGDAPERPILEWLRDHPGGRRKWPISRLRALTGKGLLEEREIPPKGGIKPSFRRVVRPVSETGLRELLTAPEGSFKAADEREFLERILDEGTMPAGQLTGGFSNGSYLLRKWTGRGVLEVVSTRVVRDGAGSLMFPSTPPETLFPQQETAVTAVRRWLQKEKFTPVLLHGVTGSGKTEVYCRAVEEAVRNGKQAIVMVPEISLAAYMENLFRFRFEDRVAIYHSHLTRGQRYDQWIRMAGGGVDLVVGARSALFAPLPKLGLIIVDEEFDPSYKQDTNPRYNARDAAVVRARLEGAVVILGSGSPSVQSFHHAAGGKYRLLTMPDRVDCRPLPEVELVDMRRSDEARGGETMISPRLGEAIGDNLAQGDQTILFLNRRGFHRFLICRRCGAGVTCPNCDVSLTYHLNDNRLACHYCGYRCAISLRCGACGKGDLRSLSFGTERLEQELGDLFPAARIGRIDTDSAGRRGEAAGILKKFGAGEIDILAGTQMITKGYDFPGVTLVGAVAADQSLAVPDFRAAERTYQLLCQVSGRAGRGCRPGRVIVQTFCPDHYAIQCAMNHDYRTFFDREMALRSQLDYPPLSHMACLLVLGPDREAVSGAAAELGAVMRSVLEGWPKKGREIRVMGPAEAPIAKIKGKFRWQLLTRSRNMTLMRHFLVSVQEIWNKKFRSAGIRLSIDVDPYNMM